MTAVAEPKEKKAKKETAVKPSRLIVLIAGGSGTGKSFLAANVKNALIYDTDIGGGLTEYADRIARNKSERVETGSYKDILDDLKARKTRRMLDDVHSVVIDHVSALQQESNLRHNPTTESDYGRANAKATNEWRSIREFCRSQDFNLICTAHLKAKFENDKATGETPDGAKNIEADMGIVLYLRRGNQYPSTAWVQKWRRDPEDPRGKVPGTFPATLESIIAIDGTDALDRNREPIPLATEEQIATLEKLLGVVKVEESVIEKWKKKAGVDEFSEMPSATIGKCIEYCQAQLKTVSNGTH